MRRGNTTNKKNRRPHKGDGGSIQWISRKPAENAFYDHKPCSNRENMFMATSLQAGFLTHILSQNAFPSISDEQWLIVLRIPGKNRGGRSQRRDRRGFSPRSLLVIHSRPLGGDLK